MDGFECAQRWTVDEFKRYMHEPCTLNYRTPTQNPGPLRGQQHPDHEDVVVCHYCEWEIRKDMSRKQGVGFVCRGCDLRTLGEFLGLPHPLWDDVTERWEEDRLAWAIVKACAERTSDESRV